MRFLLDTHVLLWWLADDRRLGDAHRDILSDGANEVFVSSVSVAEITLKASLGKLGIPDDLDRALENAAFAELPFATRHALRLRHLPWHHRDPFDRMLICQAQADGLVLLTADSKLADYDVTVR